MQTNKQNLCIYPVPGKHCSFPQFSWAKWIDLYTLDQTRKQEKQSNRKDGAAATGGAVSVRAAVTDTGLESE